LIPVRSIVEFVQSARVLDLVLGVLLLEAVLMCATYPGRRWLQRAPETLANLAAAGCLLTAAHSSTVRGYWLLTLSALFGALVAHLVALRVRARAGARRQQLAPTGMTLV
jgi:hypothetical protein